MTRLPERIKNIFSPRDHHINRLPLLVLMPFSGCNCRCMMCDYWKGDPDRKKALLPDDLAPQMDSFRALGIRWVLLSGGEPSLHPDIWEISRMLGGLDVKISFLTNGLLLKNHVSSILNYCGEVIVSLDGNREVHDMIRGVPGAFDRMAEGIRELKAGATGFRVTGRCVIQKINYLDLPRIIDAAHELDLDGISFLAVDVLTPAFNHLESPDAEQQRRLILDAEDIGDFRQLLTKTAISHGEDFRARFITESPAKLNRLADYFTAVRGEGTFSHHKCNAPWISAVIEADGTVRPCFFHQAYGNIHDAPFYQLINAPRALAFRQRLKARKNPICRQCVCSLYLRPGLLKKKER